MLKLLWKYVVSFFTADRIGVLKQYPNLRKVGCSPWADVEKTAEQLGDEQKTKLFNDKMREYAKSAGKNIAECAINCLRELAVTAVKNETAED